MMFAAASTKISATGPLDPNVGGKSAGMHHPDLVHGRPDQANFSDHGPGEALGQSNYAKQC